jgi:hypothetical protein
VCNENLSLKKGNKQKVIATSFVMSINFVLIDFLNDAMQASIKQEIHKTLNCLSATTPIHLAIHSSINKVIQTN